MDGRASPDQFQQSEVIWEAQDGVAIITLNSAETRNALTATMEKEVFRLFRQADENPAIRAIVFTAAGSSYFSVGASMDRISDSSTDLDWTARPHIPYPQAAFAMGVRKPVIAALNGTAAGMGLSWALSCDVRYAADTAKFATSFARRGLAIERMAGWVLPKVVGLGVAMDLVLSGRAIDAEEAQRLGLVNKICPADRVLEESVKWAHEVAQNCAPQALAMIKKQVYQSYRLDLPDALLSGSEMVMSALRSNDIHEGVASFVEKRAPAFSNLEGDHARTYEISGPEVLG